MTDRNKAIDPKYFSISGAIKEGSVEVLKISTDDQLGDIFTKALANPRFVDMRMLIGIE